MKTKKICLLYTGGTIGMRRVGKVLRPPVNPKSFLEIAPELYKLADFDFFAAMNKDSTNIVPKDWTKIATEIFNRRNEGYDGFVVAHGTDTMHFSASAVAFALGKNLSFPVVFTGAQTPPDVRHGDAYVNLLRAFKVATADIAEVVICFGDYVFRGCRAQKKNERRFDAFESPVFPPLASITEEIIVSDLARNHKDSEGDIELKPDFAPGIFQVSLIPGLESDLLLGLIHDAKCQGIILQSFGAGNVPNKDADDDPQYDRYSLIDFVKESTEQGTPVLITSQFPANATLHTAYEPGQEAIKAGAIPTGNMTSACATAKFRWVLAQVNKMGLDKKEKLIKIEEMMAFDYIGEFDKIDSKSK